jgi:hypothetical protein
LQSKLATTALKYDQRRSTKIIDVVLQDRRCWKGDMVSTATGAEIHKFYDPLWDCPETWPQDLPGYVFLARAFDEVGAAVHGAEWNRSLKKPRKKPEEPPDDCEDEAVWARFESEEEQYDLDREQAELDFQKMRVSIALEIAKQCQAGNLVSALRPKRGGRMVDLDKHLWYTENFLVRFYCCDMLLDDPFDDDYVLSDSKCWIYILRKGLDEYLASQSPVGALNGSVEPRRGNRLSSAIEAINGLWGGPPNGLIEVDRNRAINKWLKDHGRREVSGATIRRALKILRVPKKSNG